MLKCLFIGLTVVTLTATVNSAHANLLDCAPQMATQGVVAGKGAQLALANQEAAQGRFEVAEAVIQLSQTRLQSSTVRLPSRVPAGQTFAIQKEGERRFNSFSAGSALPQTDCVQINCPSTFEPGIVCWKCVESLTQ